MTLRDFVGRNSCFEHVRLNSLHEMMMWPISLHAWHLSASRGTGVLGVSEGQLGVCESSCFLQT